MNIAGHIWVVYHLANAIVEASVTLTTADADCLVIIARRVIGGQLSIWVVAGNRLYSQIRETTE
jgi:hypothetical protein